MKRILFTLMLAAVLALPTYANARSVYDSVRPLQDKHEDGEWHTFCTTWATTLNGKTVWITAAHCIDPDVKQFYVGGQSAQVVKADSDTDLAMLTGPSDPGLKIAYDVPKIGTEIYSTGYMGGLADRIYTRGYVSIQRMSEKDMTLFTFLAMAGGPGHSGSPIMTLDNVVISVLQWVPCSTPMGGAAICPFTGGVQTPILRKFIGLEY